MKEIKQYKCDYCGTVYSEKDRAERCEKNHKHIAKVVSIHYLSQSIDATGYPNKIIVEFSDGSEKTYVR